MVYVLVAMEPDAHYNAAMTDDELEDAFDIFQRRLAHGIRRARMLSGKSQTGVSSESGVSQASLSSIENERVKVGLKVLFRLCVGLEIPVWRLMTLSEAATTSLAFKGLSQPGPQDVDVDRLIGRVKHQLSSKKDRHDLVAAYRLGISDGVNHAEAFLAGDRPDEPSF